MIKILFIIISFLSSACLYGQSNFRFTHYTSRDGLSNNIVTALYQDSRGLLWIGTTNGLNYFDGVSFQTIYPTDLDKMRFHSDAINQIAETVDKNILFRTDDGIEEYNWNKKTLSIVFLKNMNGRVYQFIPDKQKNIWLLSELYLQQYNPQFQLLQNIRLDTLKNKIGNKGGFDGSFSSIDNAGNIWFLYHDVNCKWNVSANILESKYNNIYHKKIFNLNIAFIVQNKKNYYWFILNHTKPNALGCYKWNTDSIVIYQSPSNLIPPLIFSGSEKIWINSYGDGITIFDKQNNSFLIKYLNPADANSPAANIFNQIYPDKDENIWLASPNGLDKCTDLSNNFTVIDKLGYEDPQTHIHKASPDVISPYKDYLFVSTTSGFFKINTQNLKQQCFRYNHKKLDDKDCYWINFNLDDMFLLASTLKGLLIYDMASKNLQPLPFSVTHPALLDSVTTVSAFKDCNNNIWLGLFGGHGIYCWNTKNNSFIKYDAQQTGKYYFPLRHFSCAAQDDKGNIWMGYDKSGMAIFDNATQKFIQPSFVAFAVLKSNSIHEIINDHHGNLWISTSSGLFCYNQKTYHYKQYNRTDGLISNIVTGMAFDKNGILWMGTYSGLSRFDTSTKQFTNFTMADGLPAEEIDRVIYDSFINKICCTTPYSIVMFNPCKLKKVSPVILPVITSFYVMGKQRSLSDSINLSYKENFFSFNYTGANFINASDTRYEYRLDGFNKTWVNAGKRQYAGYTNLDGGDYTFRVRASTDGLHWYEMTSPVVLHIDTPFYKKIWFYFLLSFTVIAIIFFFFYLVYRSKLKQVLLALKIRNEIASDLHDDIGSSLTSIMLMSELAKKRNDDTEKYFEAIKNNAGKIIENMNDIVWAVNPNNDTMEQLLIRMQNFASSLLEKKDIRFELSTLDLSPFFRLNMKERKNFYLIFKEVIHNSFKYADCKKVNAKIFFQHKNILLSIHDDGKGFDVSQKYLGNGLKNMHNRAKEIKGKLEIISSINKGTIITLVFTPTQTGS